MKMRKDLLIEMLAINNPSGEEKAITPMVIEELCKLNFDVTLDSMGNIYAVRGKAEKYPLLNAHLDQVELWWSGYGKYKGVTSVSSASKDKGLTYDYINAYCDNFFKEDYSSNPLGLDSLDQVYELMDMADKQTWFSCADCSMKDCEGRIISNICDSFDLCDESTDVLYDVANSWGFEVNTPYEEVATKTDDIDDFYVYESKGKIYGSGGRVLGGDDKCGLFIAFEVARIMKDEPMKILFTVQEEEGCVGIQHVVKENLSWFDDVAYSLTIDRKYGNNLLWSQCGKRSCSNAFASRLALAGIQCGINIKIEDGSVADVIYIREIVEEAVNISAGYYEPHSEEEYVCLEDVVRIIKWVRKFIISEKNNIMKGGIL